jgi:ABC-2 type transport system ATP-binding protein
MSPVVVTQALTKRYGSRLAVDGVTFDVRPGEVVGLLGPNGSGKSTILRILTGYLQPSSGSAQVGGFDVVTQGLQARRQVGYVPEDVPLYTQMRVTEFLAFMGRLRGLDGAALQRAIDSSCDRLALGPVRELLIAKLSRGYRQRVAIAQAVLHAPPLLVLDEPTNGLDPRQIIELRGLIRTLAQGCAVLVTSHILAEIERVAHRAAILLDGRLLTMHTLVGSDARQWLRVRIRATDAQTAGNALRDTQGVQAVQEEAASGELTTWRVQISAPRAAEHIAASVCGAGMGLVEITEAASDLEALFLQLTDPQAPAQELAA